MKPLPPIKTGRTLTPDGHVWIFKNILINEDGLIVPNPTPPVKPPGFSNWREIMPSIDIDSNFNPKEIIHNIESVFNRSDISLAIGWRIACYFFEEIFQKYECFPMLNIWGARESGKSTLSNWLLAFGGDLDGGCAFGESTVLGVKYGLAKYSNLCFWLDEYRRDSVGKRWDKSLSEIYKRSGVFKDTLAGLIISGEEQLRDSAFPLGARNECIIIALRDRRSKKTDTPGVRSQPLDTSYAKVEALHKQNILSCITPEVIKNRKRLLPIILAEIDVIRVELQKEGINEHRSLNYAIAAVCYASFLNEKVDLQWLKWVIKLQDQ
jgi:hypothetical protein